MEIGDLIFKMMGREDPREALLAAVGGAPGSTPAAGGATPASAGTPGATAGQQAPPQPQAYTTPPDLGKLYLDLMQRQEQNAQINRGIGLMGMAFAKRENKDAIAQAFGVGSGGGGSGDFLNNVLQIQQASAARAQKEAQKAKIPEIAEQYGIDPQTAMFLYDSGKLDAVISELSKPNKQIADMGDGTKAIVDINSGEIGTPFGVKKPREIVMEDDGNGGKQARYKDTMELVGDPKRDVPGTGTTADQQDFAAGEKNPAFRAYEEKRTKDAATTITLGGDESEFAKQSAKFFAEDYQKARASRTNARQMIQSFDAVGKALNTESFRTGFAGDAELSLRKALDFLGYDQDTKALAGAELVQAFGNRMSALMRNPESGLGMPGSVSDRDLQFLKDANVGLTNTIEGNKTMIKVFKRFEQRKVEVANMMDKYVKEHGQLDAGFDDLLAKYAEEHSILEGIDLGGAEPTIEDRLKKYGPQ